MTIGVDVSDLSTGRADGTTRYIRELAHRFPKLALEHQWHYFAPSKAVADFKPAVWHNSPWPKYWTQSRFPVELYRFQPDILFMPIQQLPILRPKKMKTVAVIHDLAIHYFPNQFTYKDWLLLHVFSAQVAREADHIIAVSKTTATDIEKYYGRTKDISVIHHGLDHIFFHSATPAEQTDTWQLLRQTYPNLQKPFLLFVGQIQPRKNIVRLVEAFELLAKKQADLQLVITGGHGWLNQPIIDRIIASPFSKRIILTGPVSDIVLRALYWQAQVFVLPSLYEGFGIPVLEAMACGCPVVTSITSSLPEIAGTSAVLVNPLASDEIADRIVYAQQNSDNLRINGLQHVKQFSWDRTTAETIAIFNQL